MRTSRLPLSMVALHNTPRHSRESDYMGLLSQKKKNSQWGLRSIMSRRLYFGLSPKISNFNQHNLIHDLIRDPAHDLIRFDPDFVNTVI